MIVINDKSVNIVMIVELLLLKKSL